VPVERGIGLRNSLIKRTAFLVACMLAACSGGSGGSGTGGDAATAATPAAAGAPAASSQAATSAGTTPTAPPALRIYRSPYADVAWSLTARLKAQHHDHVGFSETKIRAYDAAGYHALVLLDYSGNPLMPQAVRRRLWPAKAVLSDSFVSSLRSVRLFLPGGEEIGDENMHVTSPFLAKYIQRWDPAQGPRKPDEYETVTEMRDLIHANDGLAILAHPWHEQIDPGWAAQFKGMEIYNAFGAVFHRRPATEFMKTDRNAVMLAAWDKALALNSSVVGIAVNDHFGPLPDFPIDSDLRDSGKIIVLAEDSSMEAYRRAFERGAVLAIKDLGTTKDRYPSIARIVSTSEEVTIDTDGAVRWIAMGAVVGTGPRFQVSALSPGTKYLRAEVRNPEGSVVFTQAFAIRQVGDADGDGDVDAADGEVCAAVQRGAERDADRVSACT
jgi:hypothetical protein